MNRDQAQYDRENYMAAFEVFIPKVVSADEIEPVKKYFQ